MHLWLRGDTPRTPPPQKPSTTPPSHPGSTYPNCRNISPGVSGGRGRGHTVCHSFEVVVCGSDGHGMGREHRRSGHSSLETNARWIRRRRLTWLCPKVSHPRGCRPQPLLDGPGSCRRATTPTPSESVRVGVARVMGCGSVAPVPPTPDRTHESQPRVSYISRTPPPPPRGPRLRPVGALTTPEAVRTYPTYLHGLRALARPLMGSVTHYN